MIDKNLNSIKISIVMFLCFTHAAVANESLTLKEVIQLAIKNNNNYKIAIEQTRESRLKVRESWGMLWPSLSTDAVYTKQGAESGIYAGIDGQYNITFVNAELAVNPGAFYNTLQSSRNSHIASVNKQRNIKAEIITNTIKLFYTLTLTQETVNMRRDSMKALMENFKNISLGYQKGVFSKLDFLRAKVAYSNEKTLLINAENDYQSAMASLNIQIGKDIDYDLKVKFKKGQAEKKELSFLSLDKKRTKKLIDDLIKISFAHRPEFIQIKKSMTSVNYAKKATESVYLWPSFFIRGQYGTSRSIQKQSTSSTGNIQADALISALEESFAPPEWNKAWSVSFGATYRWGSLSPLDSTHARAKQLRSKVAQMDLQILDLAKTIKLEIKMGILKLKSALNSLESQKENVETALKAFNASIVQYRNGIIDNTKLLESNLQLTTARTLYIKALYDFQSAKAELNKAIGIEHFKIY